MSDKPTSYRSTILLAGAITAILFIVAFNNLLFPVGDHIITNGGDGIKNYFTPVWYVAYDSGTHFTGMHYPYGDNVIYTDNQPLLSWILSAAAKNGWLSPAMVPWVLHLMMGLSFVLCAMLLASILSRWIPDRRWVLVAAVLITCMSPQTERVYVHFSLAYACFFPLVWWLMIRLTETRYRWTYLLLLSLVMTVFAFLHLYYLLIAMMFVLVLLIIRLLHHEVSWKNALLSGACALLPFAILLLYTRMTDSVSDRPSSPFGFFFYKASFQSVFLPQHGFLRSLWRNTLHGGRADMEGYAWVGYSGLVILVMSLFSLIRRYVMKRKSLVTLSNNYLSYLITAMLILAFSMTLPFSLGMEGLLDVIPFLKQFRSPGRFAWVFYYIFMVFGVSVLYKWTKEQTKTLRMIGFVCLFVLASDSMGYWFQTGKNIRHGAQENPFRSLPADEDPMQLLKRNGYASTDFQAILYLPFYHMGSEKLYIDRTGGQIAFSMVTAFHTGIPLLNTMMSRTSISESLIVSSLDAHSLIPKIFPEGMDDRPLLLITRPDGLNIPDQFLAGRGKPIGQIGEHQFYVLALDAFQDTQQELLDDFIALKDSVYLPFNDYYAMEPLSIWYRQQSGVFLQNAYVEGMATDALPTGTIYREGGEEFLAEVEVQTLTEPTWMEISFWSYTFPEVTAYPLVKMEMLDAKGQVIFRQDVSSKESPDILGNWVRASGYFEVPVACSRIHLTLLDHPRTLIDELVVRDTRALIFYAVSPDNSQLIFNNFPVGQ